MKDQTASNRQWRFAISIVGLCWLVALVVFKETAASMVAIWGESATFNHGYLVLPLSICLAWTRRQRILSLSPSPTRWGLPVLAVLGFGWLLGNISDVQVVQHLALVSILQGLVWTVLGSAVTFELLFPLAFLFFAVPMGENLVGPLQDSTAFLAVKGLELSGVPVYWEGRLITTPGRAWEVAEACSAIRYVIPAGVLGSMYAYLTYQRWTRRLAFVLTCVPLAVVANGVRVYVIIMLAHLSNQSGDLAETLSDSIHRTFGWSFFGLLLVVQFWVGLRWGERTGGNAVDASATTETGRFSRRRLVLAAVAGVVLVSLAPLAMGVLTSPLAVPASAQALTFSVAPPWVELPEFSGGWRPGLEGADAGFAGSFAAENRQVHLHISFYANQRQGAELASKDHLVLDGSQWLRVAEGQTHALIDGQEAKVHETTIRAINGRRTLMVWNWYWIAGEFTSNPYYAKLLQAKVRLTGGSPAAAAISVATDRDDFTGEAARVLQAFLQSVALRENLNRFSE